MYRTQLVKKIADHVPVSFEQKAGDQLFNLLSKGYVIIKDSALNAQLDTVISPLLHAINDTTQKFSFYIISDSTVNAFALPGGKVVINSGLILKSDKWSEIQGVIAHEMAHVTQRHHIRGVINQRGFFFILSSFLGGYSDFISILGEYGGHLESLMYSRKFEFEADDTGCKYMQQAHLDPQGMVSFFNKLLEENKENKGQKSNAFYNMLSTHPATADRIKNLSNTISKLSISKNITYNTKLADFQNKLKKQLKP
jgi:predicted Zn-dependent protease